ncbi:hypothetical protein ACFPIJ_17245 [Dactylosporangium cerinum]|uniref:Uncharacterized protein n=1 Tax=Dactylosporangium cerinum TaxID=1434730 RepID=A0ABV9VU85_9ACTN
MEQHALDQPVEVERIAAGLRIPPRRRSFVGTQVVPQPEPVAGRGKHPMPVVNPPAPAVLVRWDVVEQAVPAPREECRAVL